MTAPTLPQFWHIAYPVTVAGEEFMQQMCAENTDDAYTKARYLSRQHGYATITGRRGLIATYINGQIRWPITGPVDPDAKIIMGSPEDEEGSEWHAPEGESW